MRRLAVLGVAGLACVLLYLGLAHRFPQSTIRAQVDGPYLYLLGTLDANSYKVVLDLLDEHPRVDTLVLTANGGSTDDEVTLDLGRELRRRGLDTHLVGSGAMASGGLSLFLAGVRRTVGPRAHVGVHSWEHCWTTANDETSCKDGRDHPAGDPAHDLHARYVEEMLGSRDFYWFSIHAAPSDDIHWMSQAELRTFGIATPGVTLEGIRQPFGDRFVSTRAGVCGECDAVPPALQERDPSRIAR